MIVQCAMNAQGNDSAEGNDSADGSEAAQGNGGAGMENNQRNNLNSHIEALVDGMADYGVDFVLQKIAAIKNRRTSETEV